MALTKGYKQLLAEANARIETIPVEEAVKLHGRDDVVFVDIRDVRELEREGMVPGSRHAPRGMLEFWVDPESPYYKEDLAQEDKKYVLYCQSGWRSALATDTLREMGMTNVAHVDGGFGAWKGAGGPVGERPKKQ
jgi:rhodanese-related sulfurtransferase